jgi:hypothetical protein
MIIKIDIEKKSLLQNSTSLHDKSLEETRKKRSYLNIVKLIYAKPIANIILNGEKLKSFPLKTVIRQECPLSPLMFNLMLEFLARVMKQEREIKLKQIGKKKLK